MVLFKNMEDMFYKLLKKDREFNNPALAVPDQGAGRPGQGHDRRHLQAPTSRARTTSTSSSRPRRAVLHFDLEAKIVRVYLDDAEIQHYAQRRGRRPDQQPDARDPDPARKPVQRREEDPGVDQPGAHEGAPIARGRLLDTRAAEAGDRRPGSSSRTGRTERVNWWDVRDAFVDHGYCRRAMQRVETER